MAGGTLFASRRERSARAGVVMKRLLVITMLGAASFSLLPIAGSAAAAAYEVPQEWLRIENRWRPGEFVNVENGLAFGRIQPGWQSAQWGIARTEDGYFRIGNRWRDGDYLHVENGRLQSGPILPGWHSAMWMIEPAEDGYVRIRNRYRADQYIHVERGRLQAGRIQPGWHSAMWRVY